MDLNHLHPTVRQFAGEPDESRIRRIKADRWISYSLAEEALARLEWHMAHPRVTRMPCLLCHGDSGMGKTMLLEKFTRDHPERHDPDKGVRIMPVLALQMPARPDEKRFFAHLLDRIGAPVRPRDTLEAMEVMALRLLRHMQPSVLALDELQHLLAAGDRDQRRMLNLIKYLANELRISVIGFGTDEALQAIQADRQVASRFTTFAMPPCRESDDFLDFLASAVAAMPLRRESVVNERKFVRTVLAASSGVTGNVMQLLRMASIAAIETGEETLTVGGLENAAAGPWRLAS